MNGRDKISKLSIAERIAAAKAKTERVVDHLLYVLELHENNEIIVYSPKSCARPLITAAPFWLRRNSPQ